MHQHLRFGGGVSASVLHPAVLIAVLIAGVSICILPRNKAVSAFLAAALLIPMDQVLLIGRAHFSMEGRNVVEAALVQWRQKPA